MSFAFRFRDIGPADLLHIHRGLSDARVTRYYGVHFHTLKETGIQMDWYQDQSSSAKGKWWIVMEGSGMPVGACGYNDLKKDSGEIEIGFWLYPEHWGKGIMKHIFPELLDRVSIFPEARRITAYVEAGNQASSALLERYGFTPGPTFKEQKNGKTVFVNTLYHKIPQP